MWYTILVLFSCIYMATRSTSASLTKIGSEPGSNEDSTGTILPAVNKKSCLQKPFKDLRNNTICKDDKEEDGNLHEEKSEDVESKEDLCLSWEKCSSRIISDLLFLFKNLPSCPCLLPSGLPYNNTVYDHAQNASYRWRIVNNHYEKLNVYKRGAAMCIRQMMTFDTEITSVQQCCYDNKSVLITRGSGAGTPNLVSPDMSVEKHKQIDVYPWLHCAGDWTRYNKYRPPNNARGCKPNPTMKEFKRQIKEAKDY